MTANANRISLLLVVAGATFAVLSATAQQTGTRAPYQGFGAATVGGDKSPTIEVTSLEDDGPGTLRSALKEGNRRIVFRVGGSIRLKSSLAIREPNITIDGEDAPPPGITIRNHGISIRGTHDVIIRHIRVRGAADDNLSISGASRNIVIDHCSSTGAGDGVIDIVHNYSHPEQMPTDITVSWCLLAETPHAMLWATAANLSLHHNIIVGNDQRSPQLRQVRGFDVRNNLIHDWGSYGTRVRGGSMGNVVNNVYGRPNDAGKSPDSAFVILTEAPAGSTFPPQKTAEVYFAGNIGPDGKELVRAGTAARPMAAPAVDTLPAAKVAAAVVAGAGARPIDETDRRYVNRAASVLSPAP